MIWACLEVRRVEFRRHVDRGRLDDDRDTKLQTDLVRAVEDGRSKRPFCSARSQVVARAFDVAPARVVKCQAR